MGSLVSTVLSALGLVVGGAALFIFVRGFIQGVRDGWHEVWDGVGSGATVSNPKGEFDRVIAIEPGISTGVAVLDTDGSLLRSMTLERGKLGSLRELLMDLFMTEVVVEKGPVIPKHNPDSADEVEALVSELRIDVAHVSPSQWKGHPAARLLPADAQVVRSKHERDATRLGRWYQETRRRHEAARPSGTSRGDAEGPRPQRD